MSYTAKGFFSTALRSCPHEWFEHEGRLAGRKHAWRFDGVSDCDPNTPPLSSQRAAWTASAIAVGPGVASPRAYASLPPAGGLGLALGLAASQGHSSLRMPSFDIASSDA